MSAELYPPLRFGKIKFLLDLIFRIAILCVRHYPFSQGPVSNAIDYQSPHNTLAISGPGTVNLVVSSLFMQYPSRRQSIQAMWVVSFPVR